MCWCETSQMIAAGCGRLGGCTRCAPNRTAVPQRRSQPEEAGQLQVRRTGERGRAQLAACPAFTRAPPASTRGRRRCTCECLRAGADGGVLSGKALVCRRWRRPGGPLALVESDKPTTIKDSLHIPGSARTAMTTIRSFKCDDLFSFNNVNLDLLTETARALHFSVHRIHCVCSGICWHASHY